jgi:predicted transcriptional regulator
MLKNITLKIDDHLLTRVRHLAVDENKSVSAWVSELIARTLHEADEYEQARREAIDTLKVGFHLGGRPLSREEVHDRR